MNSSIESAQFRIGIYFKIVKYLVSLLIELKSLINQVPKTVPATIYLYLCYLMLFSPTQV